MTAQPPISLFSTLRWDAVQHHVRRLAPATIVEFGCGMGGFGARLCELGTYTGIEPDETSHSIASGWIAPRGGTVLYGDHRALPDGAQFDLVCAFEVLEHIEDDKDTLAAWATYVRPGGHLMISVPAWPHRYGPLDEKAGHLRRYAPDTVSDLLVSVGLESPDVQVIGWPIGFALDRIRNQLAARQRNHYASQSMGERTASSGRFFHLRGRAGTVATNAVAWPFCRVQRMRPTAGTNLVAVARRDG